MNIEKEIDARGLNCPMPILRTKKMLGEVKPGGVLKITTTDPGSQKDMEAFCRQTGNELVQSHQDGNSYVFLVRKC